MYNPSPFLISSAALTSIFSFFFGGYFREREKAYRYWIRYLAYDVDLGREDEVKSLCAELESKDRVFRQAKGLLLILLLTLFIEFVVFQFYSLQFVMESSPLYEPGALHTYIWFCTMIGVIVFINFLEMLYIWVAISPRKGFPFFRLRHRVSGQDRLAMLWQKLDCPCHKSEALNRNRIPESFYRKYKKGGSD
ncbi:MAG: hypothetical protein KAS94_15600 [Desulfobulbaceae bacterium]|nr:hypothetical protein [Desulfobulbaceae bacterium]